jgi:hypothetical protein
VTQLGNMGILLWDSVGGESTRCEMDGSMDGWVARQIADELSCSWASIMVSGTLGNCHNCFRWVITQGSGTGGIIPG